MHLTSSNGRLYLINVPQHSASLTSNTTTQYASYFIITQLSHNFSSRSQYSIQPNFFILGSNLFIETCRGVYLINDPVTYTLPTGEYVMHLRLSELMIFPGDFSYIS